MWNVETQVEGRLLLKEDSNAVSEDERREVLLRDARIVATLIEGKNITYYCEEGLTFVGKHLVDQKLTKKAGVHELEMTFRTLEVRYRGGTP